MIGGQIIIVFFGGSAFQVTRINGRDWGISIVVGALSLPLGVIIRLLPTAPFARLLYKLRIYRDPEALPEINPDAQTYEWNEAITRTIVRSSIRSCVSLLQTYVFYIATYRTIYQPTGPSEVADSGRLPWPLNQGRPCSNRRTSGQCPC